jgi:hypothetical protein
MIISKRKFNEKMHEALEQQERERYIHEKIDRVEREIYSSIDGITRHLCELEQKVDMLDKKKRRLSGKKI